MAPPLRLSLLRRCRPSLRHTSASPTATTHRHASSSSSSSGSFKQTPSPPRLPKEEQEVFEQLQRQSTGAFSTPRPQVNQSPQSADGSDAADPKVDVDGAADGLHPNVFRGARPEFEGDVNPKTGEVGGPKNEPLRWGGEADWSYNGKVTDF